MKIIIIIIKGTTTQIALRIIKHHTKDFTNKSFNHGTEDKATHVGSTALVSMILLMEKISRIRYVYCLCISNSYMFINTTNHISMLSINHFKHCFAT